MIISLPSQEEESDDDKSSAESSDSGNSDFSSDIYSLTLNETGPEMVVLGTLRKVTRKKNRLRENSS